MGGTLETDPTLEEIIAATRLKTYEAPLKMRGLSTRPHDPELIDWWQGYYRE